MKKETQCVHAGAHRDDGTRGLNTPVFTSTAYEYLDRGENPYQRYFNTANQEAVVRKLCALEGAEDGIVFGSGMAAISTVLFALLKTGDHAVLQDDLYGRTHALVTDQFDRFGIRYAFAPTDAATLGAAIMDVTRVIFVESPTNPLLRVMDLRAVARLGRARGIVTVMDNTFASPVCQIPLKLGIDVVIHSGTKYLGGHSDLQCGAAVGSRALMGRIRKKAIEFGGSLNAASCSLLERSLKTLVLRVERQTENAGRIAAFLQRHPRVKAVHYPGLRSHPGHKIARSQMKGFGAMLAFELDENCRSAGRFMRRLKLIRPALSLGGVETTICDPASTSHVRVSAEVRRRLGITDSLMRLSVGIEHADDLIADLSQALASRQFGTGRRH